MKKRFVKDYAETAFGIVLLEYHNKNHLQGNDASRNDAVAELMSDIMQLEISEEIRTHAQNVQN